MQIKNVIYENDYEFSLSSFMALSSTMTSQIAFSSSINLLKDGQQQQEIQKICILLFDSYNKICMQNSNTNDQKINISKQSIQGRCLKKKLNEI